MVRETHGDASGDRVKRKRKLLKRRRKANTACDRCRVKKSKCDADSPLVAPCSRCKADNTVCARTRFKPARSAPPPSGYVEVLEQQVEQLTAGIQKICLILKSRSNVRQGKPSNPTACLAELPPIHTILERLGVLTDGAARSEAFFRTSNPTTAQESQDWDNWTQGSTSNNGQFDSRSRSESTSLSEEQQQKQPPHQQQEHQQDRMQRLSIPNPLSFSREPPVTLDAPRLAPSTFQNPAGAATGFDQNLFHNLWQAGYDDMNTSSAYAESLFGDLSPTTK